MTGNEDLIAEAEFRLSVTGGPDAVDGDLLSRLVHALKGSDAELTANLRRCGAHHPTNPTVVPCAKSVGHSMAHVSSTGCAGSVIRWPNDNDDTLKEWADDLRSWRVLLSEQIQNAMDNPHSATDAQVMSWMSMFDFWGDLMDRIGVPR